MLNFAFFLRMFFPSRHMEDVQTAPAPRLIPWTFRSSNPWTSPRPFMGLDLWNNRILYFITSVWIYHIISNHIISYYVNHIISYYIILYHIISSYIMLYHIKSYRCIYICIHYYIWAGCRLKRPSKNKYCIFILYIIYIYTHIHII